MFIWKEPKLEEKPGVYFNRQLWATFRENRAGVILAREGILNPERIMWGSDSPHTEGTFPHSREAIARDFAGVPEALVHKIVVSNVAQLYGLS